MAQREPIEIESLRPADTPEHMTGAWLGCISFALRQPDIVAAFRRDTGNQWIPGRNGIEVMVDAAAGVDRAFIVQFIRWVNANVWGPMDGPEPDAEAD